MQNKTNKFGRRTLFKRGAALAGGVVASGFVDTGCSSETTARTTTNNPSPSSFWRRTAMPSLRQRPAKCGASLETEFTRSKEFLMGRTLRNAVDFFHLENRSPGREFGARCITVLPVHRRPEWDG